VASHSCGEEDDDEEDEEEEEDYHDHDGSTMSLSTASMEDHHGDGDETQPSGILKHRSAVLPPRFGNPPPPPELLSTFHQMRTNSTERGRVSSAIFGFSEPLE